MRDPLFEPIKINRLEVKNRIYMPAMHMNMAHNYEVTDRLVEFYAERARGGAGMIVVGYATVDELSGNVMN
ncbi:MAG: NADH:flavin oxidoreductase, partial [Desulfobacterales bacterium]|nr:NADH:flavin oxidoreductase [Desulfobacterales bacterium]